MVLVSVVIVDIGSSWVSSTGVTGLTDIRGLLSWNNINIEIQI